MTVAVILVVGGVFIGLVGGQLMRRRKLATGDSSPPSRWSQVRTSGTLIISWVRQCPVWQLILSVIGFNFVVIFIVGGTIQWLVHHHFDIGVLIGSATGSTLASLIIVGAWRSGQLPTR